MAASLRPDLNRPDWWRRWHGCHPAHALFRAHLKRGTERGLASVHRFSRQNEKDRAHGACSKYPEMIANEKRSCLLDGHRGGKGLWSTRAVLPATGDLVLQICKSQKSIIIVVIIIVIIIVVVIIIITATTTTIIIIISSSSSGRWAEGCASACYRPRRWTAGIGSQVLATE